MAVKNGSFLYYFSENNESSIQHLWHLQQDQSLLFNISQLPHLVRRYPWTSCALLSGTSTDAILGGEFPAFKNNYMDLLGTPILVIVGIILNLLAFIVLHHKDFRDQSTMFFMAMLAFSNVMTLSLLNGIGWLVEMTGSPSITSYHDSICKIWHLIIRVIQFSSIWFIVAMIIDQYIKLKNGRPKAPQQRGSASLCMPRLVTVSIYVGMTVINIHAMWLFEVLAPRNMCKIPSEHDAIYVTAWNWVSATTSVYLPILLLIIFTFILIVRLCHFKETGFSVEDWKVCRATVIVSGVFLLLCLPLTIINILQHTLMGPQPDMMLFLQLACAEHVASWCPLFNIALDFFIYIIFVPRFGKQLVSFIKRKKLNRRPSEKSLQKNLPKIEVTCEMSTPDPNEDLNSNDGLESLLKAETNGSKSLQRTVYAPTNNTANESSSTVTVWVHMDELKSTVISSNCSLNCRSESDIVVSSV